MPKNKSTRKPLVQQSMESLPLSSSDEDIDAKMYQDFAPESNEALNHYNANIDADLAAHHVNMSQLNIGERPDPELQRAPSYESVTKEKPTSSDFISRHEPTEDLVETHPVPAAKDAKAIVTSSTTNSQYFSEKLDATELVKKKLSLQKPNKEVGTVVVEGGLLSTLPKQKESIIAKRGAIFTLMVAGESGLGKTTFLNTLYENEFLADDNMKLFSEESLSTPLQWRDKTTRITCREAILVEKGFEVKFTFLDTPGFGDYSNNSNAWAPIVSHIDGQHQSYMLQEEQPIRKNLVDTRVHAFVYFIRPNGHGLLPLDIEVMKELSTRVNLIPVIAKADSLTLQDLQEFKQRIRESIVANGIDIYTPPPVNDTANTALDLPFSIIGSTSFVNRNDGTKVRGRQYKWGSAEVENPKHSDFDKLRRMLMSENMLDLIESTTDKHYQRYRSTAMKKRIEYCMNRLSVHDNLRINVNGGVETLTMISKYGRKFLEEQQLENDPLVQYVAKRLHEEGQSDLEFEKQSLLEWSAVLAQRRDEMIEELENHLKAMLQAKDEFECVKQELKLNKARPMSMRISVGRETKDRMV